MHGDLQQKERNHKRYKEEMIDISEITRIIYVGMKFT